MSLESEHMLIVRGTFILKSRSTEKRIELCDAIRINTRKKIRKRLSNCVSAASTEHGINPYRNAKALMTRYT